MPGTFLPVCKDPDFFNDEPAAPEAVVKALVWPGRPVSQSPAGFECLLSCQDPPRGIETVIAFYGQSFRAVIYVHGDHVPAAVAFLKQLLYITKVHSRAWIIEREFAALSQWTAIPFHHLGNQLGNGDLRT